MQNPNWIETSTIFFASLLLCGKMKTDRDESIGTRKHRCEERGEVEEEEREREINDSQSTVWRDSIEIFEKVLSGFFASELSKCVPTYSNPEAIGDF